MLKIRQQLPNLVMMNQFVAQLLTHNKQAKFLIDLIPTCQAKTSETATHVWCRLILGPVEEKAPLSQHKTWQYCWSKIAELNRFGRLITETVGLLTK